MRLAPHGQTRLLSIPVDSCRFVPSRTRPLTHALVAPSRRRAESTGIELRAKPTDHFSTRLRRPGGLGGPGCLVLALKAQRGGAREVIESAEARHASGAFLPLHLSGVSSWVASRDHRDFQDDRDGPVAQAAPESIRPLTHAAPRTAALTPALVAPGRPRAESTGIDGSRQESSCTPGRPRSRLGPAPEPLPSRASLRTGKLDSCRFLSTPVDSSPHARGPAQTRARPREGAAAVAGPAAQKNIFTASNARFRARRTSP